MNLKTRGQFHKTAKQELRLKFFRKWKSFLLFRIIKS